ncbi:MAG: hypothetical protein MUE72_06310 [Chitinophagaceae bacterium]|jgi:DNA integrity scanning protein DisA with diadenylate cyclase activity|nr:hypothetical protein [Chitinophagaceae bacterium]
MHLYFLADDFLHIPASASNIWVQQNSLRPVGNISLHLDYLFSSTHALGYHITNLCLHISCTIVLYYVIKQLFKQVVEKEITNLSLLVAILFFCYPFHSEAIFWIIGRSGSLGALFFLLALYSWLKKEASPLYSIGVFIFFQLALFSYESAWVFPFTIILFIMFRWHLLDKRNNILLCSLLLLQFLLHLFIRFKVTGEFMNQYDANSFVQFNIQLLGENFFRLLARTLVPPYYNNTFLLVTFLLVFFTIVCLIVMLFRAKKINRFFILLTLVWLLSYLPYLSIGIDTHGVEGERYLYLPSVFFCVWLVYLLHQLFHFKITVIATLTICSINILFLQNARNYYLKAGKITQVTIEQINQLSSKQRFFFNQLPQYNKGAVVFRTGLEDAVKWLGNNKQQQIIVVSKNNSDEVPTAHHYLDFRLLYKANMQLNKVSTILIKDSSYKKNYIVKDTFKIQFNPLTDAWFDYTDTSLTIIR